MIVAEIGINHFGSEKELKLITDKLINSPIKNISIMCQSQLFYEKYKKKGLNFEFNYIVYDKLIKKFKEKKKKIGLSVCDLESFNKIENLNFDFYKLLSVAINDYNLIEKLKKKRKKIFISTGFGATDSKISKCLKKLEIIKNKIELLHTPITYSERELNLRKILYLKKKFNLKTGYSHHFCDISAIYASSSYKPDSLFFYCKPFIKKNRVYPDDKHAVLLKDIDNISINFNKSVLMHNLNFKQKKKYNKIKVFNEIKK